MIWSGADLAGADLAGADLAGADVEGLFHHAPENSTSFTNHFKLDEIRIR